MIATTTRRKGVSLGLLAVVAVAVVAALGVGKASANQDSIFALPRSQTLVTTGTMWSPYNNLNPFMTWAYITGTQGLVYEHLFNYDPLKDKWTPWLASSGSWTSKTTYTATVRSGVQWSDGKPLTAADVKFSFEVGKIPTATFHQLWTTGPLRSITTSGNKVSFHFGGTPNYQEWDNDLYNIPIVPQHIWQSYSSTTIVSGALLDTDKLVGTGPYTYKSGLNSTESFVWQKRPGTWWATKVYGLNPKVKYIVDVFNGSNNASLASLLSGVVDISNNFLPGINTKVGGKIQTYFSGAPYMLSGNTAWLVPNLNHAPLNDPQFRKALAASINVGRIVDADYGHIVQAANPTGLLPTWSKYVDKNVVKQYGFSYSVAKAKSLLAAAGYKDTNGDGFVENKDGSKINLSLIVPNGWSDWMTAIQIIADSAKDAGIKITPAFPDYNTLVDDRGHGNYDLVINNDQQIGNTPWAYYNYLFRLPILDNQTTVNYERYNNPTAWSLTQKLDKTPASDQKAMKSITSQLQTIFLKDLPVIPLWYNGVWAQWNTSHWSNFSSSKGAGLQNIPATWRGYWQMGGIQMLSHLKPAG
jgi:peptide/nickel transport system substrate-binding protein